MKLSLGIIAGLVLMGGMAQAADPTEKGARPYVGLYGGVAIPETIDNVSQRVAGTTVQLSDLKLQTGPIVGLKLGILGSDKDTVVRWFGLELDVSYLQSNIKDQDIRLTLGNLSGTIRGEETRVRMITGAAHVLVRFSNGPIQPYIGAGPAVVHARISESNTFAAGNSTTLGLSAVGGFRFAFSDHIGGFLEYKHIRSELEFDTAQGDAVIHAGVGGIHFMF